MELLTKIQCMKIQHILILKVKKQRAHMLSILFPSSPLSSEASNRAVAKAHSFRHPAKNTKQIL